MKFLTNLTLGKKLTLLTTLGLVLGISVFSFLGLRSVNQATETMLEDRMTTAHIMADYLNEVLGRALTELEHTTRLVELGGGSGDTQPLIEELEETYRRLSIYTHSIYLLDEQERVIWSKPKSPEIVGYDMSLYPGISQTIKEGEPSISGLLSEPLSNTPVVFLIGPIKTNQQVSNGAIIMAVDLARSSIGGFVRPIRLGETGYVEIVDQNGIVVARTEPGPKLAPFEKSEHSGRFAALIAAGEPTRGLCHTCHEPAQTVERRDVLAFVPLSKANWGVVIRQSEDEALAPIRELRQGLILYSAVLAAVALLFLIITTRDIVSRVRVLTLASRRIADGDLVSPVNISQKDEVGVLAQSLENMRIKLKTSYGDLEQRTKELSSLLSISEMLSRLPDLSNLDTVLGSVLDKTLEIIKEDIGSILLLDEERQLLCCQVNHGLYKEKAPLVCYQLDEGISSQAVRTGEAILVEDISVEPGPVSPDPMVTEGLRGLASVPLRSKGNALGVLNVASRKARKFSPEDTKLLEGIARQVTAAIENARLHHEVQRKEEIRGELLQDIFSIQEEERRRIARELHDETSQVLASLDASLEAAAGMLPAGSDKAKAMLRKTQSLSIHILDDIHKLIYELRPSLLDDLGLVAAVRWLAENNLEASGIAMNIKTSGRQRRLPTRIEATLFRVIQEAVNNIAKHSQAKNTSISLQFKKNVIKVHIRDDGRGFDVEEAISSKDRPRGLGLVGMRERAAIVNGTLDIRSHPGGGGTEIIIEIPLN